MQLYPLKFYEIIKPKIWGGRRIESVLAKMLPEGVPVGESWEISDYRDDVSIVRNGPLEGKSLREIMQAAPEAVLGEKLAATGPVAFPLLVKFIDASKILSVQVHPGDAYAAGHDPNGDGGKNEAWYVVDADPGATLYCGLERGTTADDYSRLLGEGRVEECLHPVEVKAGDVIHIAAGTVHATGAGILLAEFQQTSDATYRIYDWGRTGDDGHPRPLHLEEALDVIDFDRGPVDPSPGRVQSEAGPKRTLLDECEYFAMERLEADAPFEEDSRSGGFEILMCIEGAGSVVCESGRYSYTLGDTMLLPASLGRVKVAPSGPSVFIKAYVP